MNIIERKLNDVTVLDLEGGLALEDNAQFRKLVTAIIDAGARKLIVNMGVTPWTAAGWATSPAIQPCNG